MFREMRRKRQALSREETEQVLLEGQTGVLAVLGDDDYPYAVPINYVYENSVIYLHAAQSGHKLDAIRHHDKVSFCVITEDTVIPEKFSTHFRSAIAFGRAEEVLDDEEKWTAMRLLNKKYAPLLPMEGDKEIESGWKALCVIKINIEHLTGKVSKDQMN